MIYMGSKNRIAKEILPIILKNRKEGQFYVEPMVGGGNMIDKVEGNRIGSDFNPYVIEGLKLIRDNPELLPNSLSEQEYQELKNKKELNGITGVLGFACSFGSKWFGGYARGSSNNYALNAKKNALKQSLFLQGIDFLSCSYNELKLPPNSIIYCDPPYEGTTSYKNGFNHSDFWQWCREKTTEGHIVYVSEYNAPNDFECVWEKQITTCFSGYGTLKPTEKLFIYNPNKTDAFNENLDF